MNLLAPQQAGDLHKKTCCSKQILRRCYSRFTLYNRLPKPHVCKLNYLTSMEHEEVLISDKNSLQSTRLLRARIQAVCFLQCIVKDVKSNSEKLKRGSAFYAKVVVSGATFHGVFTNNHVVSSEKEAKDGSVTFGYDEPGKGEKLRMRPDLIFCTNKELDYTFIGMDKGEIDNLGIEPIEFIQEPPVSRGDQIFIFQHPRGRPKEFSCEEVMAVERPFVYYKADTELGSSGSPVLKDLKLLAVHHKGREGEYNKGTLCSEILQHMNNGTYSKPKAIFSDSQDKEIFEGSPRAKRQKTHSKDQDGVPTEDDLDNLVQEIIPFYKQLGRKLGIANSKIEEISRDHISYGSIKDKAFQVLMEWLQKPGNTATYGALSKALQDLGRCRLAQQYC